MTKKKKSRKTKAKNVPVSVSQPKQSGTKVLGQVFTPYVQTQVPAKHAADVCTALAQMILADYHRSFCPPNGSDEHNE